MIPRYTRPAMAAIWSEEEKYRRWLQVEILALEAWESLGRVPEGVARLVREKAQIDSQRIGQIESQVRHDVIAFVSQIAETVGDEGKYIHYGLTSSDVVDTALSSLLGSALGVILSDTDAVIGTLGSLASKYKDTLMIGRTHGVHAEPITFGLTLAVWYEEMKRNRQRIASAMADVLVGKISGAVGTYANLDPFVERYVCSGLGLTPAPVSSQIVQRDRHAACVCALTLAAGTLEKMAYDLRGLARTEIREIEEPFAQGQKGSSAMPHKRNPIGLEQICGMARIMRGYAQTALENNLLWHERDISNSSVERVILPDATTLLDYMLVRMDGILRGMAVFPERMEQNLGATGGLVFSQEVLLALVEAGMQREAAYDIVQAHAMAAWDGGESFKERVMSDPTILGVISAPDLAQCFRPERATRHIDHIFRRIGLIV